MEIRFSLIKAYVWKGVGNTRDGYRHIFWYNGKTQAENVTWGYKHRWGADVRDHDFPPCFVKYFAKWCMNIVEMCEVQSIRYVRVQTSRCLMYDCPSVEEVPHWSLLIGSWCVFNVLDCDQKSWVWRLIRQVDFGYGSAWQSVVDCGCRRQLWVAKYHNCSCDEYLKHLCILLGIIESSHTGLILLKMYLTQWVL